MAINSDLMQEILLRVRTEGSSELDKAKQGVAQLQGAIKALGKDFSEGNITAGQWVGAVGKLGPPLKQLNDFVRAASDETKGWTSEIVKLSAAAAKMSPEMLRLGLATKAYRDEQEELTKATSRVHPEIAKMSAAAAKMAPEMLRLTLATKDHAAEIDAMAAAYSRAAASPLVRGMTEAGREATASSQMVAKLTAAVREQSQAYDDMAAVRARLGQMESSDHSATQERLRDEAALRMQEVQSAVEGAKQKDAAIAESMVRQRAAVRTTGDDLSRSMREQASSSLLVQRGQERIAESAKQAAIAQRQMTDGSKSVSYGLLNIAHAAQDAQYGFGALLNNVPLVAQAFGFGPGLAGTIMIAGVAAETFKPHLRELAVGMGILEDKSMRGADGLKAMKEKLAAIADRPWKVAADFGDLKEAEKQVDKLEARINRAKAAASQGTSDQEASGRAVKDVLTDFTGGGDPATGVNNLVELIRQGEIDHGKFFERDPEFQKVRDLEQGIARNQQRVLDPGTSTVMKNLSMKLISQSFRSIDSIKDRIDTNQRGRIQGEIGAALEGNEGAIGGLARTFDENEHLFTHGISGRMKPVDGRFGTMLRESAPAALKASRDLQARLESEQKRNLAAYEEGLKAKAAQEAADTKKFQVQGDVGEAAFDEAERIKGFMGAQYELKPLEPFKRAVSPYERRQQALGRRRQAQQAATREQGDGLAQEVSQARPDLNAQQVIAVAGTANHLMAQGWNRYAALAKAILQLQEQAMQSIQMQQAQMNGLMGTVGQMRTQLNRMNPMQQRRNSLMPSPIPGRQR